MKTINKSLVNITKDLNEQQKQAVMNPINQCTMVVAGAGTGKTNIISKRFVKLTYDLLNENIENPVSRILVITFTDKASVEMKERIHKQLKVNDIDCLGQDLWISTFHSFCSRLLKKHSIEVNLSPSFKMADQKQRKNLFERIIKKIKYEETNTIEDLDEILISLNLKSDILSIGSVNKLSKLNDLDIIFNEIFNIINKIKSLGITPLEFLNRSFEANTFYSGVVKSIPFGFNTKEEYLTNWSKHLSKYTDSFCEIEREIIKNDGKKEYQGAFKAIADKKLILTKNGKSKACEWGCAAGFPNNLDDIENVELHLIKIIAIIYAIYQNELERLDIVDFDDLINKTIQILKQNELVRQYYQKLFKHIIIDEFQDTNGAQLELIKLLLNNNNANLTFVGDRKQSIYSFRFAQMENLEVLHKYVEQKHTEKYPKIQLITNYRSTPHVLKAINHVTKEYLNLNELLLENPSPKEPYTSENKYVKVTTLEGFEDSYTHKINEAKYIASEIIKLKSENNAKYKDFAVLVRSHGQAEIIEKQLNKAGIPAIKKVNTGFFINSTVKNAIALLQLVENIRNEVALVRILSIKLSDHELYNLKCEADKLILKNEHLSKLRKMNLSDKLIYICENNAFDNLNITENIRVYLKNIFKTIYSIVKQKDKLSLLQIYYKLINEIEPYLPLTSIEQYQAETNLRIFEKIIADFMIGENFVSVRNFIEYVEKIKDDRNTELPILSIKEFDAVQLLTIHASKGLEFPYVFVTSISTRKKQDQTNISFDLQYGERPGFGIIAHKFNGKDTPKALLYKELWKKPREENEKLRLFYVAITRAEKYLNIISFKSYKGTKPESYIQEFPQEIHSEIVDISDIVIEKQLSKLINIPKNEQNSKKINIPELTTSEKLHLKMNFSMINTFKQCQKKYLLKYKYRYPEILSKKDTFYIGKIIHNLIYSSYITNKTFNMLDISEFLSDMYVGNEDYTEIISLYNSFLSSDYSPDKLSNKKIYPELNVNFVYEIGDKYIEFSGDIDLLINNKDGTHSIIDFKTNRNIKYSLNDYFMQLFIYKKALEKDGYRIKESKLVLLSNKTSAMEYVPVDYEGLEKSLNSEIVTILGFSNDLTQTEMKESCTNCGYLYLCE